MFLIISVIELIVEDADSVDAQSEHLSASVAVVLQFGPGRHQ
jgi:hypothetical protein